MENINNRKELSDDSFGFAVKYFNWKLIFKLLLNIYREKIAIEGLSVNEFYDVYCHCNSYKKFKDYAEDDGLNNADFYAAKGNIKYKGIEYFIYFRMFDQPDSSMYDYEISFSYYENTIPCKGIYTQLLMIAYEHCTNYKGSCYELVVNESKFESTKMSINAVDVPKSSLATVFLQDDIKDDIERFIYTFRNYDDNRISLKYLLSGKPGLGKTEVVRAVINECKDYGTVLLPGSNSSSFKNIFEYSIMFKKVIICIDDIDLMLGNRTGMFTVPQTLGTFLNALDGILQNNTFLLATTNDKNLVDEAASRPGRFDEIIDFVSFERKFYMPLIELKAKNNIAELFDEEIFDIFERNNVTGAFIVNLLKQVNIIEKKNSGINKQELIKYITKSYKGFYKTAGSNGNIGFTNNN